MPRSARLEAPGVLHHVVGRGIERRKIFWNDKDRVDFIRQDLQDFFGLSPFPEEREKTQSAFGVIPS